VGGYDPEVHHRRSVRLKAYDYSLPGPYFVTICVEHRVCVLGTVDGDGTVLSAAGLIIASELNRIEERSPVVSIDAAVVMPNHIHAIISITPTPAGARFIAPGTPNTQAPQYRSTADDAVSGTPTSVTSSTGRDAGVPGADKGSPVHEGAMNVAPTEASVRSATGLNQGLADGTLGEVVRAFKAASARAVRRDCDVEFAWQGNYHERVIRNDRELGVFFDYIQTNPARWSNDVFFVADEQANRRRVER